MMTTNLNSECISLQAYAEQQGLNVQDAVRSMTGKLVLELRDEEIVSRRPTGLEGLNRRLISASSLVTNYDLNGKVVEELRIGDSEHHFCGLVELLDPVPRKDGVEYRNFRILRTDEFFPSRSTEGVCFGYQHGMSVVTPYKDLLVKQDGQIDLEHGIAKPGSSSSRSEAAALRPAPARAVCTSGGMETETPAPAPRIQGWVMKKAALIKKHENKWKTIKGDFHSASENGLSKAAKSLGHGNWFEGAALDWARQQGKLKEEMQQGPVNSIFDVAGVKYIKS